MQSKIIEDIEVNDLKVASLPSRPTAQQAFGGRGYSATEMKKAFDKFPEFILEKLNLLIEDLLTEGENSYVGSFKTGITSSHTLSRLIIDIMSGELAGYLTVNGTSLADKIESIESELQLIKERLEGRN